jgi:hypothetical protein
MKDATLKQSLKFLAILKDAPAKQLQAILGSGLLADLRDGNIAEVDRDVFRKVLGLNPLRPVYVVAMDYETSIEDLIRLGKYDWSNSDITTSHFPTKRTGKTDVTIEPIHFNRSISSSDAIKELDRMGFRPAEGCEFLAFGSKYPDVQREFPIVALGSVWRHLGGLHLVVCLNRHAAGRRAHLSWLEGGWDDYWRFAAVRK